MKRYRTVVSDSTRWDGFEFRDGDVVISTPPKCGTTWTQMLCALLIFDTTELARPLAELSPWLDMQLYPLEEVYARLAAQQHRRFIKTHTPLDGLPWDDRVTYLGVGRDPRDVAVSWAHHLGNLDPDRFLAAREDAVGNADLDELVPPDPVDDRSPVRRWIEDDNDLEVMTLGRMLAHLQTLWDRRGEPNVALFHYADYSADLVGQTRRLARVLGIDRDDDRLAELAAAARFDAMKARADRTAPNSDLSLWRDAGEFFHRGSSGQWREVFTPEDVARYDERVAELVPGDLAAWVHGGWLGAAAERVPGQPVSGGAAWDR